MKTKFTTTKEEINALQTLAVEDGDGGIRPAKTMGGTTSRTGLTVNPWLAEEGWFVAYRPDALRYDILSTFSIYRQGRYLIPVFEGHGTEPESCELVEMNEVECAWRAWREFRKNGEVLPSRRDYEIGPVFDAVRRASKGGCEHGPGYWITRNEALGLAHHGTLNVEVREEDGWTEMWVVGIGSVTFMEGVTVGMFHAHGVEGNGVRFEVGPDGGDWLEVKAVADESSTTFIDPDDYE